MMLTTNQLLDGLVLQLGDRGWNASLSQTPDSQLTKVIQTKGQEISFSCLHKGMVSSAEDSASFLDVNRAGGQALLIPGSGIAVSTEFSRLDATPGKNFSFGWFLLGGCYIRMHQRVVGSTDNLCNAYSGRKNVFGIAGGEFPRVMDKTLRYISITTPNVNTVEASVVSDSVGISCYDVCHWDLQLSDLSRFIFRPNPS